MGRMSTIGYIDSGTNLHRNSNQTKTLPENLPTATRAATSKRNQPHRSKAQFIDNHHSAMTLPTASSNDHEDRHHQTHNSNPQHSTMNLLTALTIDECATTTSKRRSPDSNECVNGTISVCIHSVYHIHCEQPVFK